MYSLTMRGTMVDLAWWLILAACVLLMLIPTLVARHYYLALREERLGAEHARQVLLIRQAMLAKLAGEVTRLENRHDQLVDRICQMQRDGMIWLDQEGGEPGTWSTADADRARMAERRSE
jgi:hypothetical protein